MEQEYKPRASCLYACSVSELQRLLWKEQLLGHHYRSGAEATRTGFRNLVNGTHAEKDPVDSQS